MPESTEPHEVGIRPERPGDGATWYRAVCSCGQSIRHLHDTPVAAARSGRGHLAVNTPQPPGRYQLDRDGGEIRLGCLDCDQELVAISCEDDETRALVLTIAVETHESRQHADEIPQPEPVSFPLMEPVQLAADDDSIRWTALRRN